MLSSSGSSVLLFTVLMTSMGTPGRSEIYTAEAVLSVFNERADPHEPLTSSEISEELDCSRQTAYNRLQELTEEGVLNTKKVGARSRVWWLP